MKLRAYLTIAAMLLGMLTFPSKAKADTPTYIGIETGSAADWGGQWNTYIGSTCGSNYAINQMEFSVDGAYELNAYGWDCSTDGTNGGIYASYVLYTDSSWVYS